MVNYMMTKQYIINPIGICGSKAHGIAPKGFSDSKSFAQETELPFIINLSHGDTCGIINLRQNLWKGPQARSIAISRHIQAQSIMRSFKIIGMTPRIKRSLEVNEISPLVTANELLFKRAVETLIFPKRLGMIRTAVDNAYIKAHQPDSQGRMGIPHVIAPWRSIIHQHGIRKSIAFKSFREGSLYFISFLAGERSQANIKAGEIVQDSQGVPHSRQGWNRSFKIHLPEAIGGGMLKSLPVFAPRLLGINKTMAMKGPGNGAAGRHRRDIPILQASADLAGPPAADVLCEVPLFDLPYFDLYGAQ